MKSENATILIVDDNPVNLGVLFDVLDEHGFEVLTATSGASALKRLERARPDVIVLDIMMPGMDGFETCRRLKALEQAQNIPIVFMTALTDTREKVKGFEAGAVDYITKPIQADEALARIRTHLAVQRLHNELEANNAALTAALQREQELNALKSRLISLASHELRTPLTTVKASTDMLLRYADRMPPEKQRAELERVMRAVARMTGLLDDVLTTSKAEAGGLTCRLEPLDLKAFCARLVEQFESIGFDAHTVRLLSQGDDFVMPADPQLLEHVLTNLLSNALKYSPNGGIVTVELARQSAHMTLSVSDEGIGISADDRQHLFDAFHRGGNVGRIEGIGLGMSIVKQCVQLHGGVIDVRSELGRGTRFTITLPLTPNQ